MIRKLSKTFWMFLVGLGILVGLSGCGSNTPDAVFHRGVSAYQESDPIGASLYFEDFIKKFPDDERVLTAYQALARCYYDLKDFANMRAVFEDMKTKFPDPNIQLSCDFQIGGSYANEGFFDKAVAKFGEIVDATTNPRIQVQALGNIAGVYARQTQSATAQQYFDRIFTIGDTEIQDATESLDVKLMALSGKANVLKASSEFETARSIYKQTLDLVANATGITGIENDREKAILNWVGTWKEAGDYITSVTMYDKIQSHPYIQKDTKPWLIIHKIDDLQLLFRNEHLAGKTPEELQTPNRPPEKYTPEEVVILVNENQRLVNDFPDTDFAINARVAIAQLIRDTSPTQADEYFNDAIELYEKYITTPTDPQKPLMALFQIADSYIRYGKLAEAKQTLERIRQSYSQVPQAMQSVAMMQQTIENIEREQAQLKLKSENSAPETIPSAT